mmetsp:Transcript_63548/g.119328  ORF Transcript_63548/g.119328 Transcript_63548/m.119328 type:complete len:230 (+) Transcript_63548:335-1024(+)
MLQEKKGSQRLTIVQHNFVSIVPRRIFAILLAVCAKPRLNRLHHCRHQSHRPPHLRSQQTHQLRSPRQRQPSTPVQSQPLNLLRFLPQPQVLCPLPNPRRRLRLFRARSRLPLPRCCPRRCPRCHPLPSPRFSRPQRARNQADCTRSPSVPAARREGSPRVGGVLPTRGSSSKKSLGEPTRSSGPPRLQGWKAPTSRGCACCQTTLTTAATLWVPPCRWPQQTWGLPGT